MFDSLWPHGLQQARLPYPSSTPRACSSSYPSSWWCHPITSSSVVPFYSCLQSFPASRSFPMSQSFASGDQSTGASASAWKFRIDFLSGWLVWSPSCPRDSQQSSPMPQFKSISSLVLSLLYGPIHIHTWLLEKNSKFFQIPCRQRAPHVEVTAFDLEMLISCSR